MVEMSDQTLDDLAYIISAYTDQAIEERSRLVEDLQISEADICDIVCVIQEVYQLRSADYYRAVDGLLDCLLDEAQTVGDLLSIIRRAG